MSVCECCEWSHAHPPNEVIYGILNSYCRTSVMNDLDLTEPCVCTHEHDGIGGGAATSTGMCVCVCVSICCF